MTRERWLVGDVVQCFQGYERSFWSLRDGPEKERPEQSFLGTVKDLEHTNEGDDVHERDIDCHRPVDITVLVVIGDHFGDFPEHLR